ncbi:MAG: hypothetical protein J5I90_00850 [Caldilineales bacterium]|nr:hypothetical protein [Caldilineales bacterium]
MNFPGFRRPRANFYRLPNDWFDIWRQARSQSERTRILGALKVSEYLIKWTWGYQNYDQPLRLSWLDFQRGRQGSCRQGRQGSCRQGGRRNRRRLDLGTGLSSRSLQEALSLAVALGLMERHEEDAGQFTYLPRLRPAAEDEKGFDAHPTTGSSQGFARPTANFFLVPASWTDLTADVRSETLILLITYFFRHTWGWHGHQHEPCWLSEEDIAHGRRFADPARKDERYDAGICYTGRAVRKALKEGVERGWLVWRYQGNGRIFALSLEGMTVAEDGQIVETADPTSDVADSESPTSSARSTARTAQSKAGPEQSAAIMTAPNPDAPERSTVAAEQTAALPARSKAAVAQSKAPPIDQDRHRSDQTDNPPQKTTTDTVSALGNGISDTPGYAQNDVLPLALQEQVRVLGLKGRGPQRELLQAWREDPLRIGAWLQHLVSIRSGDPQAAGFLLQVVVRQRAAAPNGSSKPISASCAACQGARYLQVQVPAGDPHHGLTIPCPSCNPTAACT